MNITRLPALARIVLAFGLVSVLMVGFARISLSDMRASDDNIWLYVTGLALAHPADSAEDPERLLIARVRDAGGAREAVIRYEMRADYRTNYLVPMLIWGGAAAIVNPAAAGTIEDYARAVGAAIVAGAAASHGFAILLLVLGVLATGRSDLVAATFGGITLLLALTLVAPGGAAFLFWELQGIDAFRNAFKFALHPDAQYSVFGFTPRSQLALIVLLVFILRWRGWIGAGYAVLALGGLVHQSMASLAFAAVLGMDIVVRPSALVRRSVWPFLLLAAGLIAVRETLWAYVLAPAALLRLAILLFGVALMIVLARKALRSGHAARLHTLRARIAAAPLYQVDATLLAMGWLLTLPVGYVLAQYADPLQRLYFWNQVHSRSWMLIAPAIGSAIVLAAWHAASGTVTARLIAKRPLSAAILVVVLVLAPLAATTQPLVAASAQMRRLTMDMAALGRRLNQPLTLAPTIDDEALLYLGLARQRDTGEPYVKMLLPGRGG